MALFFRKELEMSGFSQIIGREDTVRHLQDAIRAGKVSHAYLLEGETGTGKLLMARTFAQALQCRNMDGDCCGECPDCRQAEGKNHPDIIYITHEKPGLIRVDAIRQQVVADAAIRPYSGRYKIYIVEDAQKMNPSAQNALLKTLEEPPEYVVIMLLTNNAQGLLETIRSRCELIRLKPVRDDLVEKYLMEHLQVPDYQARLCLAFARGSIGRAMELAASDDFAQIRRTALMVAARARDLDVQQLSAVVKEMAQFKVSIGDFLDILAVWYRDVLYFKATTKADALIFREELAQIRTSARLSSYEGIETILRAIETAKTRIEANVNFDLAIELLFLTIKEN